MIQIPSNSDFVDKVQMIQVARIDPIGMHARNKKLLQRLYFKNQNLVLIILNGSALYNLALAEPYLMATVKKFINIDGHTIKPGQWVYFDHDKCYVRIPGSYVGDGRSGVKLKIDGKLAHVAYQVPDNIAKLLTDVELDIKE